MFILSSVATYPDTSARGLSLSIANSLNVVHENEFNPTLICPVDQFPKNCNLSPTVNIPANQSHFFALSTRLDIGTSREDINRLVSENPKLRTLPAEYICYAGGKFYVDEKMLGAGGMGSVSLARDIDTGAPVAIKTILASKVNDKSIERFRREYEATSQLDHPSIVRSLAFGQRLDGSNVIVMEYIEAPTLRDLLDKRNESVYELAWRLREAVAGVSYAHTPDGKPSLVHRDLKPENLLCPSSPVYNSSVPKHLGAKVADFGLVLFKQNAVATGSTLEVRMTEMGEINGTLDYMPIEQALGNVLVQDTRVDVYSLGSILYEIIVGVPPLHYRNGLSNNNKLCTIGKFKEGRFKIMPPSNMTIYLRIFDKLISRVLDPNKFNRGTAAQFMDDLDEILKAPGAINKLMSLKNRNKDLAMERIRDFNSISL